MNIKSTLFASLLLLLLTACQAVVQTPDVSVKESDRFNMAIQSQPATLDPHRTSEPVAESVFSYICERLIYQGIDLANHGLLAESWEFDSTGLSLTVKLRKGILFHDGTTLTSEAVKFTFERLQHPDSELSPIYEDFQGVQIERLDPETVLFTFDEPRKDFLVTLRNSYAAILSPAAEEMDPVEFGESPVCTGPFQVAEWSPMQYIRLVKNENYAWPPAYYDNRGPAQIDEIQINFMSESNVRYLALLNGELDMLGLSTPEEVQEISEMEMFNLKSSWKGGISYLGFNYQRSPTDELLVRQAIAHAVDKTTIINAILPSLAEPAHAPLPPSTFGYGPELADFGYQYNPDLSRQLLVDAGFSDDDGDGIVERDGQSLQLELLTNTSNTYGKVFVFLQSQLKAVGIEATIRTASGGEIAEITPTGEFDLLLYHYAWPYPSALSLFLSTDRVGGSNRVAYSNAAVDELLAQIALLIDDSPKKLTLLLDAQKIILQDAPWHPLLFNKRLTAINQRVKGVRVHPSGGLLLHDASIIQP